MAVTKKVRELGHVAIVMDDEVARPANGRQTSLEQLASCHVLVGLIGWRYGTILPGDTLSITEQEYRYAKDEDIDIAPLMFLSDDKLRECMVPQMIDDAPDALKRFRNYIEQNHVRATFTCDVDALVLAVERALNEFVSRNPDYYERFDAPPRPHGDFLVGRDGELNTLHETLLEPTNILPGRSTSGPMGIRPVAVVGMLGVGKTALVREYVYSRHLAWPGGIFWLNCGGDSRFGRLTETETLIREAARAATKLKLVDPFGGSDFEKAQAFVARLYKRPKRTLLVIDNVANPRRLLDAMIGDMRIGDLRCHILITCSRHVLEYDQGDYDEVPLKGLEEEAAKSLLLHHTDKGLRGRLNRQEMEAAEAICASVGNHPLALELAAKQLAVGVTPSSFLTRMRERGAMSSLDEAQQVMSEFEGEELSRPGIRAMLLEAWDRLRATDPINKNRIKVEVLRTAACFPVSTILTFESLARACDPAIVTPTHPGQPSQLKLALKSLVDDFMIEEPSTNCYRLHPFVHEFVRGDDVENDAERRLDFERSVVRRYITSLCTPKEIDRMMRVPGGMNLALADLRMATDLAHTAGLVSQGSVARSTDKIGHEDESQVQKLVEWLNVFERAADTVFVATHSDLFDKSTLTQNDEVTELLFTTPLWQYIHNSAVELDAKQVLKDADEWLSRLSPRIPWIKLDEKVEGRPTALIREFDGHRGAITAIAWNPDASIIVSGGRDRSLRIWSVESLKEQAILPQESGITAVSWSGTRDNFELAWSRQDGTITLWNAKDWVERRADDVGEVETRGLQAPISALSWNQSGDVLASGFQDGSLKLWPVNSHETQQVSFPRTSIRALSWHGKDQLLACGTKDGMIHLLGGVDLNDPFTVLDDPIPAHRDGVKALAWNPVRDWLASSGEDGKTYLWTATFNPITGEPHLTKYALESRGYIKSGQNIAALGWSSDGSMLAAGGTDGAVYIWAVGSVAERMRFVGRIAMAHADTINALAWSPKGGELVTAGVDGLARLWCIAEGIGARGEKSRIVGHERPINSVVWSPTGQFVTSVGEDAHIGVWDANNGKKMVITPAPRIALPVAVSPDGQWIAGGGGGYDRSVQVVSVQRLLRRVEAEERGVQATRVAFGIHQDDVSALAWSANGTLLATASENVLRVWDWGTCLGGVGDFSEPLWKCSLHDDDLLAIAWHPLQQLLASASRDNTLRIWDVGAAIDSDEEEESLCVRRISTWNPETRDVSVLAWDPSGRALAVGDTTGTIRIWIPTLRADSTQPRPVTIRAHRDSITALAWHRTGAFLATAGRDRTVRVWRIRDLWRARKRAPLATFVTYTRPLALHWPTEETQLLVADVLGQPWRPRIYHLSLVGDDKVFSC